MQLSIHSMPSPFGQVLLASDERQLLALDFEDYEHRFTGNLQRFYPRHRIERSKLPQWLREPLDAYFSGDLRAIDTLAVAAPGTAFQQRVWGELRRIEAGTSTTYGSLARTIGKPKAARAVGLANGTNPIAIVVPCHRVIGANGKLTGYGGGLARKAQLLEHEACTGYVA